MISQLRRSYITIKDINKGLSLNTLKPTDAALILKENLQRYYNNKLISHLKYEQWEDFFYLYATAKTLDHGVNLATSVIAAHGTVMAVSLEKSIEILEKLPQSKSVQLTSDCIRLYDELKRADATPASVDWAATVSLTAAAVLGSGNWPSAQGLNDNLWEPWFESLRPWKHPRNTAEIKEELRFKRRSDK